LLARIHRYTVNRLRQEIEPVSLKDFVVFLGRWQHVDAEARKEGPAALAEVIGQLEGFEAPAAAWETELLPARVDSYDPTWLDELSLAGRVVWTRLSVPRPSGERVVAPVRTTPIALLTRRNLAQWMCLAGNGVSPALSTHARDVSDVLERHGASFFEEIVAATGLLPAQVEEALAELTAQGLINADGFIGLRSLLVPSDRRRPSPGHRRRRRTAVFGIEDAGRWALVRRLPHGDSGDDVQAVEQIAWTLLRRYGVVFHRLLDREASWLPPWRDLLRVYRRLEARGEIRGGRFVAGVSGEQYAVPEAVNALRDARRREGAGGLLAVSGADPLNLVGLSSPGPKLPALTANRVLYLDGVPIAVIAGGQFRVLEPSVDMTEWDMRAALVRRRVPAALAPLE
jgi:ATP-dependent Lhr-like helicase